MMDVGIPTVHQGMFSTLGGYHEYSRGYHESYQAFYGLKHYNL